MGFRNGSYATVWSVEPVSDKRTKVRINISRKNRQTGEYEQDFGGFVMFCGEQNAKSAARLSKGDRIKLGDVEVTTKYVKETKKEYVDYACFSFDTESSRPAAPQVDEPVEDDDEDVPF